MTEKNQDTAAPLEVWRRQARIVSLIETNLTKRGGGGDDGCPEHILKQYWTLDGEPVAQAPTDWDHWPCRENLKAAERNFDNAREQLQKLIHNERAATLAWRNRARIMADLLKVALKPGVLNPKLRRRPARKGWVAAVRSMIDQTAEAMKGDRL